MLESPRQFLESVLLVIAALLPIVGPLSGVPLYLRMTAGIDPSTREPLARLVAFDGFLLLLGSAMAGQYVLNFFGVSIGDVQFADSFFGALANAVGMAVVAASVYVCYRYGTVIRRKLGATGAVVRTRLSAFLLLCIGVHIAGSGALALLEHVLPKAWRPASGGRAPCEGTLPRGDHRPPDRSHLQPIR